ncbi:hypothetical protein SAMN02746089_00989 [Caldanaerobius fijiensis DSM 17918]|uniref:Uncharacterized protein n=1 Tax=Caldanaerobius fijiensis DSM 17918 TaxID=1121256 RepID=A0A1M4X9K2_9THEO|nr:hypothetical protein [Caldanaerobius fijiensis]SHE90071.1 hypothetical protein SAMN02746089_00989 [Caldanaerobius fijiensis DSM 17918]
MRKLVVFSLITLFMLFSTTVGYAANLINVKSDIDNVKTFDDKYIISGTGVPGTFIAISINKGKPVGLYIGASGLFAKEVLLSEGNNYVIIVARKGDAYQIVKGKIIMLKNILKDIIDGNETIDLEDLINSLLK